MPQMAHSSTTSSLDSNPQHRLLASTAGERTDKLTLMAPNSSNIDHQPMSAWLKRKKRKRYFFQSSLFLP
ncbi:hypothetical protein BDP27DRAFT_1313056 [Rhodocollybia butyracea]|uniref:Uncharacterized protein n=1 Tax=Rhodocollybia butyracea TaxID=206335 RepID=A0A9P5UG52_9AGAR|nr:hypothetical protein BDP27DRAFT_1313056 [Rhodocollybia butyracea]